MGTGNRMSAYFMLAMMLSGALTFCYPELADADDTTPKSSATAVPSTAETAGKTQNESAELAATSSAEGMGNESPEMAALQERLSELEKKSESDSARIEELTERLDMQEMDSIQSEAAQEMNLQVYGFLDVQFSKLFIKEDTFYKGYLPDASTFTLGHWNLFIRKSLSDHFSVLGEVRFLFQPMGEESDWVGFERTEYSRFDTRATDVVDNYFFNWGGISIQRAYVQYSLNDYFGLRIGYYLTPFGIWNEEHASPVILFAHRPFLSTSGHLPEAQLGLYLFGKAYLGQRTILQYGFTVSNGRGPTAEVYDLDENKALGLTLQASYDGAISLNTGTYLYMGDYRDIARSMTLPTIGFTETTTIAYAEKAMSLHLQFGWRGLRLQGEYVRRLIEYEDGHRESADHGRGILFTPDHVRSGSYELLAYTLPFENLTLTPYVLHEYKDMPPWVEYWAGHSYGAGINWQIIPPVVFKVEGILNKHRKEGGVNSDFKMLISQLAVTF
jgi:hypothetical protein